MKKITLILVILLFSASWATTLIKAYHGNYGEIDRVVLVLNGDADYSITSRPKKLKITLRDTKMATDLADKIFEENPVLEAWDFVIDGDDLLFNIYTDKKFVTQKPLYYKEKNNYKLVIDVFNTVNPQTYDELMSYASYNEKIQNKQALARKYRDKAAEVKQKAATENNQIEPTKQTVTKIEDETKVTVVDSLVDNVREDTTETAIVVKDTVAVDSSVKKDDFLVEEESIAPESIFAQRLAAEKDKISQQNVESKQKKNQPSLFTKIIIVVVQLLLVFFILKIVIKLIKENLGKKQKNKKLPKVKEVNYRSEAGFGDAEFKIEIIKKLKNKGWQLAEIARELELSEAEVTSYLEEKPQEVAAEINKDEEEETEE
jgi:hypothetical protein